MSEGRDRAKLRSRVVELLGSKCTNCGTDDVRVLQINHVENDGHLLKRGGRIRGFACKHFRAILNGTDPIERYELLCANCHQLRTGGHI